MSKKLGAFLGLLVFGGLGIYFTFIFGNTKKYDEVAFATNIEPNEYYDADDNLLYKPIYTFKVKGVAYTCTSKSGSSFTPKEDKNKVYYDSKDPSNCMVEYEKSNNKVAGIVCLIAFGIILYAVLRKEPEQNTDVQNNSNIQNYEMDPEKQQKIEETAEKVENIISKVSIIYKRVIIGIIILVLIVLIIIDSVLLKQTIKSKNYPEAIAILINESESNSTVYDDYVYTFEDKKGVMQEIIVSFSKGEIPDDDIKIKYNEKDPQDYYLEGSTLDKKGIIWFGVKIVIMALLMVLFSSKKLLDKIHIS